MSREELYKDIKKLPISKQIEVYRYVSLLVSQLAHGQAPPCPQGVS